MKTLSLTLLATTLLGAFSLHAQNLRVSITTKKNTPMSGYIVRADATGIHFSANENGAGATVVKYDDIGQYAISPPEGWTDAVHEYDRGNYEAAEPLFTKFAATYARISRIPNSTGSLARYYELKTLLARGNYRTFASSYDAFQASEGFALAPAFMDELKALEGWKFIGKTDYKGALAWTDTYKDAKSETGSYKPGIPSDLIANIACVRAVALEQTKKPEEALREYKLAQGINYGNQPLIANLSLLGSMRILHNQVAALKAEDKKNYPLELEAHTTACTIRDILGAERVQADWKVYLTKPAADKENNPTGAEAPQNPAPKEASEAKPAA